MDRTVAEVEAVRRLGVAESTIGSLGPDGAAAPAAPVDSLKR
ncbi:hypothetical protein HDA32_004407 [Spinactinospora alkalitolerans]|uniref:Uncharacterized protein n=1 Tax=Spinactinospora alkalitolerans TaxID=687207 RepID=A0A852U145_9ACTN|nr:hypothetical protein [Spinactinospora alkalitolerans]NYE49287.1 hypothetical protein [Spinactinospora alkalitolerans]